jgi:hypothetical protein
MRSLPVLTALLGLGLLPSAGFAQPAAPAQPTTPAPAAPAQPAPAQPKAPPKPAKVTSVCPGKVLPLQANNSWTYESVQARDSKGQPVFPPDNMTKLLPLRATKLTVTVTGVETTKDETTVKLKETVTYDITKDPKTPKLFDQVVESKIVCSKTKFDISPESFFFAGEPGGYRGLTFTRFERKKETSLKLTNGVIGEAEWIEEIAAEYKKEAMKGSGATLGGGKLEMERKFTPQAPEGVQTRFQLYPTAEKLGITTSGRIMLDTKVAPDGKPCVTKKTVDVPPAPAPGAPAPATPAPAAPKAGEAPKAVAAPKAGDAPKTEPEKKVIDVPSEVCELPANWISQLWLVDNVGLVQVLNPYAHMYQLVEAKLN